MRKIFLASCFISLALCLVVIADEKPKLPSPPAPRTIALSDTEAREIQDAANVMQARSAELQAAFRDILEQPLEKAVEMVAKAKLANSNLQIADLQAQRIRDKHRAIHTCPNCSYSSDFKSLIEQVKK